MRLRSVAAPCLAWWLVLLACPAAAQSETPAPAETPTGTPAEASETPARDVEARYLFEAGRNAYDNGRYTDALDYFQRGYELSGRPILLYNIGQAADRLRHDETALVAFKRYLAELPDAENRPQVEERIRVLEEVLAARRAVTEPVATSQAPDPAVAAALDAPLPRDEADDGDDLLEQWWFWAGAGGVVAAIVVVAVVAGSSGGGGEGEPTQGSNGVTIAVLSLP